MKRTKRLVAFLVVITMLLTLAPAAFAQAETTPTETEQADAKTPEGTEEGGTATSGASPSTDGNASPSPSPDATPSAAENESPSPDVSASPEPNGANGGISPMYIDPDDTDPGDTAPHRHKLCGAASGAACLHTGAQHGDAIEFESIENYRDESTGAFVFPHDANVYVPKDTNLGKRNSVIPAGVTVTICLDGNTLIESPQTATLDRAGFAIEDGGTLNLCDCKGTGSLVNFNDNDFTVYDTGTLNMYGGTLERSDSTPPIRLIGTFNMYGGAITGNYGRCAVEVTDGRINLYGGVIDGNYTNDVSSYKSNVELSPGAVINIPDKLYPGTRVGVSCSDSGAVDKQDVRITNGYSGHNIEAPSVFFFSDNPAFQISLKEGDAYLARIPGEPHPSHPSCGENPCPHGGVHQNVTDWEDLNHTNKPVGGHNYYLSADYVLPSNFDITGGKETTLCLNGHKLTVAHQHDTYDSVILLEHGTLRICDCQGGGEITGGRGSDFNFYGGNIYVNGGNLELYGGTISGGRADRAGGGVYVKNGSFEMYGGVVSNNHGDQYGGGVYVENGTFDLYGGSVTNNAGTGVHVDSGGVFTMTGGTISGNSGDKDYELACGGGVQVDNGGTFNMKGGTISGNTGKFGGGVEVRSGSQYRPTSGVFNLYAGTITGNTCIGKDGKADRYERGGGVFIDGGEFNLCGPLADVSGNTLEIKNAETLDDDVYLDGDLAVGIRAKLDPAKTKIGLFQKTNDARAVTSGFGAAGNTAAEVKCFFSNAGEQALNFTEGEVYLGQGLPAHVHKVCGESTCTHAGAAHTEDVTFVPWDDAGIGPAVSDGKVHNVYLTGDETVQDTVVVSGGGTVLNLCLNGYTLSYQNPSHTAVVPVIRTQNGAQVNLCDCGSVGRVKGDGRVLSKDAGNNGGVVYVNENSTFNQYGGSLADAYAERGGGAYVKGDFNLYGGSIAGNRAGDTASNIPGQGGGAYVDGGALAVYGGKIADNQADGIAGAINGGGVYVKSGSLTLAGGTVSGNGAYGNGGGIYANGGTLLLTGGQVTGNNVGNNSARGAGVYVGAGAALQVSGAPVIQGNVNSSNYGNVYLPEGQTITMAGDLDSSADVGVLTAPLHDRIITSGYADYGGSDPKDYFGADNPDSTIFLWQKQQDAATREAFLAVPCTVSGTVKDSATGASVANTSLSFHASSETRLLGADGDDIPLETQTDAFGKYSIVLYQGIEYGFYLNAERYYFDLTPTDLVVPKGSGSLELDIAAKTSPCKGSMDGTLKDQNGNFLAGATVTLHSMDTVQGEMTYSTQTDADGKFHLFVLYGKYDVSVTKPGYTVTIDDPRYQTTNITGGHGDSLIKVTTVRNEATVSGTVTDEAGYDMKGAKVIFTGTPPFYGYLTSFEGTVKSSGAYTATGAEGTYTVKVTKPGCTIHVTDGGKLSFISGAVTHDIKVETSLDVGSAHGTVTGTGADLLEGAVVTFKGKSDYDDQERSCAAVIKNGAYDNVSLMAGEYAVTIEKPGYTIEVTEGSPVAIGSSDVENNLVVNVQADGGVVSGSVTDGNGHDMDGATVTLKGRTVSGEEKTFTAAVADGRYRIDAPAGDYTASVAKGGYTVFVDSGDAVTVGTDDVTNHIAVEASLNIGTVSGTVKDGGGNGLPGVTVTLSGNSTADGKMRTFSAVADENGNYSVRALEGTYEAAVEKPGYTVSVTGSGSVTVTSGPKTNNITVSAALNKGTVRGLLKDNGARITDDVTMTLTGTSVADGQQHTFNAAFTPVFGEDGIKKSHEYNYTVEDVPEGTYHITVAEIGLDIVVMVPYDGTISVTDSDVTVDIEANSSYAKGTVSGTVTDTNGVPLEGETVKLTGMSFGFYRTFRGTIGANGEYSVMVPRDQENKGGYTITVEKPGYTVTVNSGSPVSVIDGAGAKDVTADITVTAVQNKGTVSGSVTGAGAKLMNGAEVTLTGTSAVDGQRHTFTGTVADGGYKVEDVPEGTYEVTLNRSGFTSAVAVGGTVVVTNGNVTNNIEISASIDIWTVSGSVTDTDASQDSMEGATVTLSGTSAADGKQRTFSGTVGAGGSYSVKVLEGSYTAAVTKPGYAVGISSGGGPFDVSANETRNIEVQAAQNKGAVSGSVTGMGAVLAEGAAVTLKGTSVADGQEKTFTGTATKQGLDYAYKVEDVLEGTYEVTLEKSGLTVMVTGGGMVSVANGDVTNDIEISVSLNTGTVSGTVKDGGGTPLSGVAVTLSGNSTVDGKVRTFRAETDADGNYSVKALEGSYTVTAEKPGYTVTVNSGGTVAVATGTKTNDITVTFSRNEGTVSGSVTDTNTPPVSMDGATVTLKGMSVAEGEKTFTGTVAHDSYTISEPVPEGTYTVTVTKPGYRCDVTQGGTVAMENGDITNNIEVSASLSSGLVYGTVKDDNGTAMIGATVTLSGTSVAEGEKTFTGTVGRDGTYGIEALDGTYTVSLVWPGHTVDAVSAGGTVTVNADSVQNDITAAVTRIEGTVSGMVTEQNGISMDGATVTLTGAVTGEEFTAGVLDGSYSITLPTGLYRISVQKAGYDVTLTGNDVVLVARDAPREKNISVEATLITYEVAGKVTETNGLSMAGAVLAFTNRFDASAPTAAILAQDGSYTVRLAPGEYAVTVIKPGYNVQMNAASSITVGQAGISGCDFSVTAAILERVPGGKLDANEDGEVTEAELAAALGAYAELSGSKGAQVVTLTGNAALSGSLIVNVSGLTLELGEYTLSGPPKEPAVAFEGKIANVTASGAGGIMGGEGAPAMQCESNALAMVGGGTYMGGSGAPGVRVSGNLFVQDNAAIYGSAGQAGVEGPGGSVSVRSAKVFGGDGAPGGTGISSMQKVTLYSRALVLGGAGTDDPNAAGGDGGSALSGVQSVVMAGGTAGGGRGGDGWNTGGNGGNALDVSVAALEANGRGLLIGGDGGDSYTAPGKGGKGNPNGFTRYDVRVFDGSDGKVPDAPVITAQPQDQEALVGDTASFGVQAKSGLSISYQWQENRGDGFTDIPGATGESYTTPVLALADSDTRYRCVISNAKGSAVSEEALLTVKQNAYHVLEGGGSEWDPAGGMGLTVRVDAPFEKFTGVSVDGSALAQDYYTAQSGSTVVTLKPEYLRTLAAGKHTLRIEFTDGYAQTDFTVLPAQEGTVPSTGDSAGTGTAKTGDTAAPLWIWILVAVAAGAGLMAVFLCKKRRPTK